MYIDSDSKLNFRALRGGVVVRKNWRGLFVAELDTHRFGITQQCWSGSDLAEELRAQAQLLMEMSDIVEKLE